MTLPHAGFEYLDLIDGDAIRILELQPARDHHSHLQCSLTTHRRTECYPYEALSYWWGPDDQGFESIVIDGGICNIQKQLVAALRHLRLQDKIRQIWADAVCINQRCKQEKSKQVGRMDATYRDAAKMLIWLGEESGRSRIAMKAIEQIGSLYGDQTLNGIHGQGLRLPTIDGRGPIVYLPAIRELLRREWFKHLWVIQEICLAPRDSVMIHCGSSWIHFWHLSNVQLALLRPGHQNLSLEEQRLLQKDSSQAMVSKQEPPLVVTRQLFATSREDFARIEDTRMTASTLLRHLWTFRNRTCKDPHDRVYALRSMALDLQNDIVPDYGQRTGRLYAGVTRKIIGKHKKLDILGMCVTLEGFDPGSPDRPSWAPDFHSAVVQAQRPFTSLTMFLSGHASYYTATGASEANVSSPEDALELRLRGYLVGTVAALGFEGAETWQDMVKRSKDLSDAVSLRASEARPDRPNAFWRTLITNRTSENQLARPDVEGREFQAWWETLTMQAPHTLMEFMDFNKAFLLHWSRRSFFTTTCGHIGIGPAATKKGDYISLLAGAQVPFVLRSKSDKFQVVGEAYVHELMDGKYWGKLKAEIESQKEIVLI